MSRTILGMSKASFAILSVFLGYTALIIALWVQAYTGARQFFFNPNPFSYFQLPDSYYEIIRQTFAAVQWVTILILALLIYIAYQLKKLNERNERTVS